MSLKWVWKDFETIWNELFYILRFKKIKKEVGPKWCCINTHWYTNNFSKSHDSNSEDAFIYEERHNMDKFSEVSEVPLPAPLEVLQTYFLEKSMRFLTSDLNTKLITAESTLRRSLCGMVVCKVLKWKIEIFIKLSGHWKSVSYSMNKWSFCYEIFLQYWKSFLKFRILSQRLALCCSFLKL